MVLDTVGCHVARTQGPQASAKVMSSAVRSYVYVYIVLLGPPSSHYEQTQLNWSLIDCIALILTSLLCIIVLLKLNESTLVLTFCSGLQTPNVLIFPRSRTNNERKNCDFLRCEEPFLWPMACAFYWTLCNLNWQTEHPGTPDSSGWGEGLVSLCLCASLKIVEELQYQQCTYYDDCAITSVLLFCKSQNL